MSRTRIIATVGPSCDTKEKLSALVKAGVDLFRLNMSHEDHSGASKVISQIRKNDPQTGILMDLQGPRIRTGRLKEKCVALKKGAEFIITSKQIEGNDSMVSVDFKGLPQEVKAGQQILIDNGLIELKVVKVEGSDIHCKVSSGGSLGEHKGVNVPGTSIFKKSLTEKDLSDMSLAVKEKVDYIALSFVKTSDDILEAKKLIEGLGASIPVIAKIENAEAVSRIDSIINVADAIMVARGDLGVELAPEEVPMIQKAIIKKCARAGRPVIVASQMLESMVENTRPTRAETTDVANAIIDGADALMLSEETASGLHPAEAAKMMTRLIDKVEGECVIQRHIKKEDIKKNIAFAVSHSAYHVCEDLDARAIITFTSSGSTALMASKWRPNAPIFAPVTSLEAARRTSLYWGVLPILTEVFKSTDEMVSNIEKAVLEKKLLKKGDVVIITAGVPIGVKGTTNLIKVHTIG